MKEREQSLLGKVMESPGAERRGQRCVWAGVKERKQQPAREGMWRGASIRSNFLLSQILAPSPSRTGRQQLSTFSDRISPLPCLEIVERGGAVG